MDCVSAWAELEKGIGSKNRTYPWELPECPHCSLYECCIGIDNLRTPILVNDKIAGYKEGCEHFKKIR